MPYRVKTPLRTKEGVIPAGTLIELPEGEAAALLRESAPPIETVEAPPAPAPKRTRAKRTK